MDTKKEQKRIDILRLIERYCEKTFGCLPRKIIVWHPGYIIEVFFNNKQKMFTLCKVKRQMA
jgi:hypothetical protein